MRIFTFLFLSLFYITAMFAQQTPGKEIGKTCFATELNEQYIKKNNLQEHAAKVEAIIKAGAEARKKARLAGNKSLNEIRTIPVVVHVVYNPNSGEPNVTDAEIDEIIQILNEDYNRLNDDTVNTRPLFQSVAGVANMNFCLAQIDPDGNSTTGIVRVNTDEDYFDPNTEADEMKYAPGTPVPSQASGTTGNGDPAWDPDRYMNIWICNITDGAGAGVAGYAYLPSSAGESWDGLVLDSDIGVGLYGGHRNRTATHEIGHYMGLHHPWGDDAGADQGDGSCSTDDGLADTPQSSETLINYFDCDPDPAPNTCDNSSDSPNGDLPDQYENYMCYATCQNMFSQDQVDLMNSTLDNIRNGLLANTVCTVPGTIDADFTADITTASVGDNITFTDASTASDPITSWNWDFGGAAASPATSTNQGPVVVSYNTAGTYTVSLTVSDGTNSDTETKTAYITITEPSVLTADFSASITSALPGTSIDFTDLSTSPNGAITSWNWTFNGADITSSTDQNPTGITWSNPGDYDVTLTVATDTENATETKTQYIHIIDPANAPVADFQASQTTITQGSTIDYTNLSSNPGAIDSSLWILEAADAPNDNIFVNGAGNLTSVMYNATPGFYDATLIIYSSFGTDTMFKDDYIHIIDTNNLEPVHADFEATTDRLIGVGSTVSFTDLSTGPVTSWHWIFEGGNPATFDGQFPPDITYSNTNGPFDVTLIVSNGTYTDTLIKTEYIVVVTQYPWPDEDGFCDSDLNNIPPGVVRQPARHLINDETQWGYFPGHNYMKVKYYAERFHNYTFDKIREIHVAPSRIYNASQNYNKVTYYIWDVDTATGKPRNVLGSKTTYISDYTQLQYYNVRFDTPVDVPSDFYVGFYLKYPTSSSGEPQDTFAIYYSNNGAYYENTMLCAKTTSSWKTPTEMLGDSVNMSLDIRLKACLIGVDEVDYNSEISIYPNPTKGIVYVDLGNIPIINPTVRIYDISGRQIRAAISHIYDNKYQINIDNGQAGFYLLQFDFGDKRITKKITLIK